MEEAQKIKIISAIRQKIGHIECPMCHNRKFEVLDGYMSDMLQDDYKNLVIGGQTLPSIALVCTYCGFICKHALGALGLMEK